MILFSGPATISVADAKKNVLLTVVNGSEGDGIGVALLSPENKRPLLVVVLGDGKMAYGKSLLELQLCTPILFSLD